MKRDEELTAYLEKNYGSSYGGDSGDFGEGAHIGARWADAHPHWISVEDELPELNTVVIAFCDLSEKFGEETYLIMTTPYDCDGFSSFSSPVSHWMPIPKQPKK